MGQVIQTEMLRNCTDVQFGIIELHVLLSDQVNEEFVHMHPIIDTPVADAEVGTDPLMQVMQLVPFRNCADVQFDFIILHVLLTAQMYDKFVQTQPIIFVVPIILVADATDPLTHVTQAVPFKNCDNEQFGIIRLQVLLIVQRYELFAQVQPTGTVTPTTVVPLVDPLTHVTHAVPFRN